MKDKLDFGVNKQKVHYFMCGHKCIPILNILTDFAGALTSLLAHCCSGDRLACPVIQGLVV